MLNARSTAFSFASSSSENGPEREADDCSTSTGGSFVPKVTSRLSRNPMDSHWFSLSNRSRNRVLDLPMNSKGRGIETEKENLRSNSDPNSGKGIAFLLIESGSILKVSVFAGAQLIPSTSAIRNEAELADSVVRKLMLKESKKV